jgi:hypothetical protein
MCIGHTNKPTLNSQCGYGGASSAPGIKDGETIVFDEEGRCAPQINGSGGTDFHSHHYRVFKSLCGGHRFAVRHGAGDESFNMYEHTRVVEILASMQSDARFLMLHALFGQRRDGLTIGNDTANSTWTRAAVEKRIRTRKARGQDAVKVWIDARGLV